MGICWHKDCTNEANHIIATGEELCDLHLAVLRVLTERARNIADPGLDGDPETDLPQVEAAIEELTSAMVAPTPEA